MYGTVSKVRILLIPALAGMTWRISSPGSELDLPEVSPRMTEGLLPASLSTQRNFIAQGFRDFRLVLVFLVFRLLDLGQEHVQVAGLHKVVEPRPASSRRSRTPPWRAR